VVPFFFDWIIVNIFEKWKNFVIVEQEVAITKMCFHNNQEINIGEKSNQYCQITLYQKTEFCQKVKTRLQLVFFCTSQNPSVIHVYCTSIAPLGTACFARIN